MVRGEEYVERALEERGIHGTINKSEPHKAYSSWTHSFEEVAYLQSATRDKTTA